jgi:hypothetical protein
VVNVLSNMSTYVSHIHQGTHTHAFIDFPSNNFESNELLDDHIEEIKNIQSNDNML